MSSPANARIASSDSHSERVMNSVRSPSSRRSIQAPRLPGVCPYSAKPVSRMYCAYSSASARRTAPLQLCAITSPSDESSAWEAEPDLLELLSHLLPDELERRSRAD